MTLHRDLLCNSKQHYLHENKLFTHTKQPLPDSKANIHSTVLILNVYEKWSLHVSSNCKMIRTLCVCICYQHIRINVESASFNSTYMFTFTHVTETGSSRQAVHECISHYHDPVQSSSHQFPKYASCHCPPTPSVYQQSHCCLCQFFFSYDLPVRPTKPLRLHFYKKKQVICKDSNTLHYVVCPNCSAN